MLSQLTSNFNVRRYYSWENSIGGGVTDGEIVQIIDYQAYLTAMFPCVFRKIL